MSITEPNLIIFCLNNQTGGFHSFIKFFAPPKLTPQKLDPNRVCL